MKGLPREKPFAGQIRYLGGRKAYVELIYVLVDEVPYDPNYGRRWRLFVLFGDPPTLTTWSEDVFESDPIL